MSETWLKAIILILVFAAVVFAVERVVAAAVGRRAEGRAINQRLELISRGASRGEAMAMLRRRSTSVPEGLPPFIAGPAIGLEKTLMAAGVTMETGKLMLALMVATVQGGAQALSRSLFASMIPKARSSEFFGFFSIFEKFGAILGPAAFEVASRSTGSSRSAILSVVVFFIVGAAVLSFVNVQQGQRAASDGQIH